MKAKNDRGNLFPAPQGYVYFLRNSDGHIKIGWTEVDPASRLKALQTGDSEKLTIVAVREGMKGHEKGYHIQFAPFRTSGGKEWFHPNNDLNAIIEEYRWPSSTKS